MLELILNKPRESNLHVLCLGAHSDDIEIGCGGTILRIIEEYPRAIITWIVFGASGGRQNEAQESAEKFLANCLDRQIIVLNFRDGFFPYIGTDIKEYFEKIKNQLSPDLTFTHYRQDLHQDHRLISELTWNTFRDHLILEYEIPKYDGDLGSPNFYVHLSEAICAQKVDLLLSSFETQREKFWFTEETFIALMRIRGIEAKSPEKFAEAYYAHKIVLK